MRTRYWYDTEFLNDGRTIDLISIGVVCEDGREYYAVSSEFDQAAAKAHDFVGREVWPYLPTCSPGPEQDPRLEVLDLHHPAVRSRFAIATDVRQFLLAGTHPPELWAWYASYDHVVYAQLWGPMSQLPDGLPMFTRDLKDWAVRLGDPRMPEQTTKLHHALADAQHNRDMHAFLEELEASRGPRIAVEWSPAAERHQVRVRYPAGPVLGGRLHEHQADAELDAEQLRAALGARTRTTTPVKALTVRQPWAHLIAGGAKLVENRTRAFRHRGPIAIHAGRQLDGPATGIPLVRDTLDVPTPELAYGAVIAVADLIDCHRDAGCCRPWGEPDAFHLVLDNVRKLPSPVPATGKLSLWTVDLPAEVLS